MNCMKNSVLSAKSTRRRLLSFLLILALTAGFVPAQVFTVSADTEIEPDVFIETAGTAEDGESETEENEEKAGSEPEPDFMPDGGEVEETGDKNTEEAIEETELPEIIDFIDLKESDVKELYDETAEPFEAAGDIFYTPSNKEVVAYGDDAGPDVSWVLYDDGELVISGTGDMYDYPPWYEYKEFIKIVNISEGVTSIGFVTFSGCSNLTSVDMPNVKTIGDHAFADCVKLENINMPNVEIIGDWAFYRCDNLTSIYIPNVKTIGGWTFSNCINLKNVDMPSVTNIGNSAFSFCSNLTSVNIPNTTTIGDATFYECENLSDLNMPNLINIGELTFARCNNLANINMPNVKTIGDWAFNGCRNLTSVDISNVISIGEGAFNGCTDLSSIYMPNVTSIGDGAFAYCNSLTDITVASNNPNYTSIDGVLFNKNITTLIAYPGGKSGGYTVPLNVTSIGNSAFSGCYNLTSVEMPNVTSIGDRAFDWCSSLVNIDMPNVISIGDYAFILCNLTNIFIGTAEPPTVGIGAFQYLNYSGTRVIVPQTWSEYGIAEGSMWYDLFVIYTENYTLTTLENINITTMPEKTIYMQGETLDFTGIVVTAEYSYGNAQIVANITTNPVNGSVIDTLGVQSVWVSYTEMGITMITYFNIIVIPIGGKVIIASGDNAGPDVNWELYSDGELVINGTGDMYDNSPWYEYREFIKTVNISENVTSIGNYAFQSCINLTSIEMPNVVNIGNQAFYECIKLENVSMPNVDTIGEWAFARCNSLVDIEIPNVINIGTCAFYESTNLTNVNMPNVENIGEWVFVRSNIVSANIPKVTKIEHRAFYDCKNLTSVNIPNVKTIGDHAFADCVKLESINMPNVEIIEDWAFAGCHSLFSVDIPEMVNIGDGVFYGCISLYNIFFVSAAPLVLSGHVFFDNAPGARVIVPSSWGEHGVAEWSMWNGLFVIYVENYPPTPIASGDDAGENISWTLYSDRELIISGTGDMYDFWELPPWWEHKENIIRLTITDGVTSVGNNAFSNLGNLTSVNIPNITSIGYQAFAYCWNLSNVNMPNVTNIGYRAFDMCWNLNNIDIPNVISIGNYAFYMCLNLIDVNIPSTTAIIGDGAFADCFNLESITVDQNNLNYISISGVLYNKNLTAIIAYPARKSGGYTLPSSVTTIGNYAFSGSVGLESIDISNVIIIGNNAFWSCGNLESIYIPNITTHIGNNAFAYCNSLIDITVDPNNPNYTSIDNVLFNKNATIILAYPAGISGEYIIPPSVTEIAESAFSGCRNLTSVETLNVTKVGINAFTDCSSLESVYMPKALIIEASVFNTCTSLKNVKIPNVTNIKSFAFASCNNLENIYFGAVPPEVGENSFNYVAPNARAIVPPSWGSHGLADGALWHGLTVVYTESSAVCDICGEDPCICPELINDMKFLVSPETEAARFFTIFGSDTIITNIHGVQLTSKDYVGTGTIIILPATNVKITVVVKGDLTGDGYVDMSSLVALARHIAALEPFDGDAALLEAADVNGDNRVNIADLIRLARYHANVDPSPLG